MGSGVSTRSRNNNNNNTNGNINSNNNNNINSSNNSNNNNNNNNINSVTTISTNNNNRTPLSIELSNLSSNNNENNNNNNNNVILTPGVGRNNNYRQIVSNDNSISLALATPRLGQNDIESLYTSVPFTPLTQSLDSNLYSYYCPLCMEYFGKILKSNCCNNYTCLSCSISYLSTKGIVINTANELLQLGKKKLNNVTCPHCFNNEYHIELVLPQDSIRDYRNIQKNNNDTTNNNNYTNGNNSPLKIGDSFENMKRKMKPFEKNENNNITITEHKDDVDDIDYILKRCRSITFVEEDEDTENDINNKYKKNYIANVSNELASNIIKSVSSKYIIGV